MGVSPIRHPMSSDSILPSSFRDPSGFLFRAGGDLYRQINQSYRDDYNFLITSGLYQALVEEGLLIPHQDADISLVGGDNAYKVIRPEKIPFISYPYEWCFSQLKDAALATLKIQKIALGKGMSLKDASAYNIQFLRGKPILIDTLSFARYREGEPWVAYRQFCQHFLAPLSLAAHTDIRLSRLLREYIDGIPLDLASRLLPLKTRFAFGLLSHIHLHGRSQVRHSADRARPASRRRVSLLALRGLIDSLESTVRRLCWNPAGTEWAEYYEDTNYSAAAMADKKERIAAFLEEAKPRTVWDLGGNTGDFSRLVAERGAFAVCFDVDPAAVEKCYLREGGEGSGRLLPLVMDLTTPSPSLGWAGRERDSLARRGPCDLVMALALVHHLAISNNVPLPMIVSYLADLGEWLIVEFVPEEDSQVQRLLETRDDIFGDYNEKGFRSALARRFEVVRRSAIRDSRRSVYLCRAKSGGKIDRE